MTPNEGVTALVDALEAAAANYVIVGAFATGTWGIPRATNDADFVVAMSGHELDKILRQLPSGLSPDPQSRVELFTGTMRWVLLFDHCSFKIEIFILGEDAHHLELFARKRRKRLARLNRESWIPSPEDMVIQKLRWARPKDIDDILNILTVQGGAVDFAYIESWSQRHGTLDELRKVKAMVPPPRLA